MRPLQEGLVATKVVNTWLTVRVDANEVKATMHAATESDDGVTAAEAYDVGLGAEVLDGLRNTLLAHSDEASERALEVGFTSARTRRLELGGSMGADGAVSN